MKVPTPYRVLLVEDDLELAELIRDFLQNYEFTVTIVTDGREAVERILTDSPDLVVLDIMLPGQNGMEVCRAVRPHFQGMILMQTALDDDLDQVMGLELGADDYIVKPFGVNEVTARIRAVTRRCMLTKKTENESFCLLKSNSNV